MRAPSNHRPDCRLLAPDPLSWVQFRQLAAVCAHIPDIALVSDISIHVSLGSQVWYLLSLGEIELWPNQLKGGTCSCWWMLCLFGCAFAAAASWAPRERGSTISLKNKEVKRSAPTTRRLNSELQQEFT